MFPQKKYIYIKKKPNFSKPQHGDNVGEAY